MSSFKLVTKHLFFLNKPNNVLDVGCGQALFLDEFKKVTNTGEIKTTHSNHIPTKNYNISGKAFYRDPVIASLDGNTVELSVEQMQFAENTMKYQTTLKFLNGKITKMISAIRGE